jgi:hypothetical protein
MILTKGASLCLSECYVKMGRIQEAMDLHKSLCDEIGKESLDANAILSWQHCLTNTPSIREHSQA